MVYLCETDIPDCLLLYFVLSVCVVFALAAIPSVRSSVRLSWNLDLLFIVIASFPF